MSNDALKLAAFRSCRQFWRLYSCQYSAMVGPMQAEGSSTDSAAMLHMTVQNCTKWLHTTGVAVASSGNAVYWDASCVRDPAWYKRQTCAEFH